MILSLVRNIIRPSLSFPSLFCHFHYLKREIRGFTTGRILDLCFAVGLGGFLFRNVVHCFQVQVLKISTRVLLEYKYKYQVLQLWCLFYFLDVVGVLNVKDLLVISNI
jgi:hypothetical protein